MALSIRKITSGLVKKGFVAKNKHHKHYRYVALNGEKTVVNTFVSHGSSGKDVGKHLLGEMARQCKLNRDQFKQLIDCSLTRIAYEEILNDKGFIPEQKQSNGTVHHRGPPARFERHAESHQVKPTSEVN